jgi:hypothetical protein
MTKSYDGLTKSLQLLADEVMVKAICNEGKRERLTKV